MRGHEKLLRRDEGMEEALGRRKRDRKRVRVGRRKGGEAEEEGLHEYG